MGAGSKSYREMDTAMELHTGSMGASIHMYVPIIEYLMIILYCLYLTIKYSRKKILRIWFNKLFYQPERRMMTISAKGISSFLVLSGQVVMRRAAHSAKFDEKVHKLQS